MIPHQRRAGRTSYERTTQVARDADELCPGSPQSPQRVEADRIGREQVRQIDSHPAGRGVADAPQLGYVRRVQMSGQMNDAAAGPCVDLDAAFHGRGLRQDWHQPDDAMSTPWHGARSTQRALTGSQDVVALTSRGKAGIGPHAPVGSPVFFARMTGASGCRA
jgi:hypothetical protein